MSIYTIIAGVNGVGKSSLTGLLKGERSDLGIIIDVDAISAKVGSNIIGGKQAIRLIDDCLDKKVNFTQETTLSGKRIFATLDKARSNGYYIRMYYVALRSLDESYLRIENRVRKGGHDIPKDDVSKRYSKRYDDVIKVLPFCDEVHFYDNDNGFIDVAEYKNGEIVIKQHTEWIEQLKNRFSIMSDISDDFYYKEVNSAQLMVLSQSELLFDKTENDGRIIVKVDKSDKDTLEDLLSQIKSITI